MTLPLDMDQRCSGCNQPLRIAPASAWLELVHDVCLCGDCIGRDGPLWVPISRAYALELAKAMKEAA